MGSRVLHLVGCCLLWTTMLPADDPRERLRDPFLFTGARLRSAFKEVVAEPRTWTVEIRNLDEQRLALGVIVSPTGEVLTKASELSEKVQCRLFNQKLVSAELIATDETNDLALLQLDATDLPSAIWNEQPLTDGQFLITPSIGETPLAVGVLGAQPRNIPQSVRGVLGIRMEPAGPATVAEVFEEGGAAAAGVKAGDVILTINSEEIASSGHVVETVRRYRPGEKIQLKLQRGEEVLNLTATLTHPFGDLLSRIAMQNQLGGDLSDRRDDFPSAFQHDAVMKPQDCGGCVVNLDGRAVGLNIARAGRTESYALPVDVVLKSLEIMRASAK